MQNLDISINDLANVIFIKNRLDKKISLMLDGVEDTYDLFCFCVDLLCKGLVLLYGNIENKVDLETLPYEQFEVVTKKMKNAGIIVNISFYDNNDPHVQNLQKVHIVKGTTNKIQDNAIYLKNSSVTYKINFSLFHSID